MPTVSCCSDGMFFLTVVQLSSHTSSEQRGNYLFSPFLFSRMSLEAGLLPFQEKASPCAKREENPKSWYL